jgi:hypothetical protein
VRTNPVTKDLRDVPGGASSLIDTAVIHLADPPHFMPNQVVRPYLATFPFLADSGGLTIVFAIYSRGERIRTSDHLNPIQVRYQAALHPVSLNLPPYVII